MSRISNIGGSAAAQTGVTSLAKQGSTAITGAVTLSEGSNISLSQVGQNIAISATSSLTPPGGATTQVQFNDGGSFGGDADFVWNKTTNVLTLPTVSSPSGSILRIQNSTDFAAMEIADNGNDLILYTNGPSLDLNTAGSVLHGGNTSLTIDQCSSMAFSATNSFTLATANVSLDLEDAANSILQPAGTNKFGLKNNSSGITALFDTSILASSDKSFKFPNSSGTFALLEATNAFSSNNTIAGYLRVGSNTAPSNTTAGDLTFIRGFMSGEQTITNAVTTYSKAYGARWNDDNDALIVSDNPAWASSKSNTMTYKVYAGDASAGQFSWNDHNGNVRASLDAFTGNLIVSNTVAASMLMGQVAPTTDQTVTAGYSVYIADHYEIASGKFLDIGSGSVFEVG